MESIIALIGQIQAGVAAVGMGRETWHEFGLEEAISCHCATDQSLNTGGAGGAECEGGFQISTALLCRCGSYQLLKEAHMTVVI